MSHAVNYEDISDESEDDLDFSIFVSDAEVEVTHQLLKARQIDLATVAGFTGEELNAIYAKGMELLRVGMVRQAGKIFFALVLLKRAEGRYYRALGLAYHYQRRFNWARIIYGQALVYDPSDVIAKCLRAECTLLEVGKREALVELQDALSQGPRSKVDLPYLERAQALANKLSVYRSEEP